MVRFDPTGHLHLSKVSEKAEINIQFLTLYTKSGMKPAVLYETDSLKALYTVKHHTGLLAPDSHYDIIVL